MDDVVSILVVLGLLGLLGYILGIIGFFRAGTALREVRQLRHLLAQETAQRIAAARAANPAGAPPSIAPAPPGPAPPAPEAAAPKASAAASPPSVPVLPGAVEPPTTTRPGPAAPERSPQPVAPTAKPDFESLLTMRWAVWLGAVALLLAGVFLIRYAAEQGLLGPATRCGAAVLLGVALLAGAEWLRRRDLPPVQGPFSVDQAPAALAAGGIAVLYGAAYGAGPFYDLLPAPLAFAAMAAVSLLGLVAALRFGALTAAVGIVGAFAAPALVATHESSLIGLFAYLAFATAAAQAVVRRTAWTWLGWAATIAGAFWIVAAASRPGAPDLWAAAAFVPLSALLGLLLPSAALSDTLGRELAWGQFATVALAALMLESAAPGLATRAAVFALSPLAVWKGAGEPSLDRLPWLAAACGLVTLWMWNGAPRDGLIDPASSSRWDLQATLMSAFLFGAAHAAVGLVVEAKAPNRTRWAALVAAVPVLTLVVCYATIGRFEASPLWGFAGLLLAALLTASVRHHVRGGALDLASVHAAGAVGAIALALGMTLHDQWLTTALALMLPGLAWIESRVALTSLRTVSIVVTLACFALMPGWLLHDLALGHRTISVHPFITYAVPAAAFAVAARIFRVGRDDTLVAMLEGGAMAAAALFVTLEVRLWFGHGTLDAPFGFDEIATLMLSTGAQAFAYDHIAHRSGRAMAFIARGLLASVAYLLAIGLLLANPMVFGASVGVVSLILAYLVPGLLAGWCSRRTHDPTFRALLAGYAVCAIFAWATLQVRQAFHPGKMSLFDYPVSDAELWTWSGIWLAYGVAIMMLGIRLADRAMRLTALALIALVCGKVFLVDMAELTGLWRVASFLGLGLTLIGLGVVHRRYVLLGQEPEASASTA